MKACVCPDCLTISGDLVVVFAGEACRLCGLMPSVRLTPKEIRACLKKK